MCLYAICFSTSSISHKKDKIYVAWLHGNNHFEASLLLLLLFLNYYAGYPVSGSVNGLNSGIPINYRDGPDTRSDEILLFKSRQTKLIFNDCILLFSNWLPDIRYPPEQRTAYPIRSIRFVFNSHIFDKTHSKYMYHCGS